MTVATTTDYNDSRDQIITDALILLGIMGPDDSLASNDASLGSRFLNRLVKYWEASGARVWTHATATVWLAYNTKKYLIGPAATDAFWATTFVETDTTAALTASATAVSCTTTTGMTIGDKIGVTLDSGVLFWTTIATIPTSTTLTLTAGVTTAAATGAYIYTFTTRPQRPIRLLDVVLRSGIRTGIVDRNISRLSFEEYHYMSVKDSNGSPAQYVYNDQLVSSILNVWPVPTNTKERLFVRYTRPIFDFDSSTDTSDMPQEWLQCLVFTLAATLAPAYGKTDIGMALKAQADEMFSKLDGYDQENFSMYMVPTQERE